MHPHIYTHARYEEQSHFISASYAYACGSVNKDWRKLKQAIVATLYLWRFHMYTGACAAVSIKIATVVLAMVAGTLGGRERPAVVLLLGWEAYYGKEISSY